MSWPFLDPVNTAVFTTKQVIEMGLPIRLVSHDVDGTWQFLCGTTNEESDALIVGLGEVVHFDPSVINLADLPLGCKAWRSSKEDTWRRAAHS